MRDKQAACLFDGFWIASQSYGDSERKSMTSTRVPGCRDSICWAAYSHSEPRLHR